ncbi:hypothetical protein M1L60_02220 [Actinoplanes sp. TRM 88003]|uniref:Uncharacterized protein n=1 Tax=Paractinoplanes aksuensis TaxID=2939490 RepID=A0ABT1DF13_9ACTN|nr:hypothetical protein [Actinoplanes aksuensis]MCO8269402.1 hypothetical protein [Actinoplanes aksuensis]
MRRIFGVELRRSNAPTLLALLIGAGIAGLALGGNLGLGTWHLFAYIHSSSMFLLLPLALAGGAVLGRREKRTRAAELFASTGRPTAHRLLPGLLALGVAVAVGHLLVYAGGAIWILASGTYTTAVTVLWPLTGVLVLAGGAWMGLAAGRAWSSPLVPPMVAVLGLLLQFGFAEIGPPGEPSYLENLSMLAQPPIYAWEAVTGRALLGYAVFGAGLIGAGFLLAAGRSWLPRVAAVVLLGVAGSIAAIVPGKTADTHYRVDAGAQKLVCTDGAPQVCVIAAHRQLLDEAAPQVREALTLLAKLPGGQTRAVEWRADEVYKPGESDWQSTGTTRPEPGTVNFDLGVTRGKIGPALTENVLLAAGTLWNGCEGGQDLVAAHAVAAWLLGKDELTGVDDGLSYFPDLQKQVPETVRGLRALPEKEQIRRVAAVRDASLACQEDLLPILTGKASS